MKEFMKLGFLHVFFNKILRHLCLKIFKGFVLITLDIYI